MKPAASLRFPIHFAFLSALLLLRPLAMRAAEAPTPRSAPNQTNATIGDEPLVISDRTFKRDGKSVAATLRNVLELVRLRYPDANITAVEVEDVRIDNLTLHWGRYRGAPLPGEPRPRLNPPLIGVLTALAEASGRKFEAVPFGENDFLLRPPAATHPASAPMTEVFNLSPLSGGGLKRNLEQQLLALEGEAKALAARYGKEHPRFVEVRDRIDIVSGQLHRAARAVVPGEKLVSQIGQAVEDTLAAEKSHATVPRFQFHEGTNLLIVTGSDRAVDLTRKIIAALEKNP
ncbi:MAG: hypothetical protein ABIR80_18100 [Opitutaceae bacterium]